MRTGLGSTGCRRLCDKPPIDFDGRENKKYRAT